MSKRIVPLDPAVRRAVWAEPESNAGVGWTLPRRPPRRFEDFSAAEDYALPDEPMAVDTFIGGRRGR